MAMRMTLKCSVKWIECHGGVLYRAMVECYKKCGLQLDQKMRAWGRRTISLILTKGAGAFPSPEEANDVHAKNIVRGLYTAGFVWTTTVDDDNSQRSLFNRVQMLKRYTSIASKRLVPCNM
ncbi:hypothetical protein L914_17915 [Phytophthora nicotianae]|uniref:Uncharacterized protein n=1 Tax=Phytophthora nicotianae TaxID=4792 RepID=W2MI37_PHYNI|nr:hypothetical protein L914_17915 [Phytophthora nicotianae]